MQLRAFGSVSPQSGEKQHRDQQRDIEPAVLDRFGTQCLLKLQQLILFVQSVDLQLVGYSLVSGLVIRQTSAASLIHVGLVGNGVLFMELECRLEIVLFLRKLVQQPVSSGQLLGKLWLEGVRNGTESELARERRRTLFAVR